jgi:hypothetical protein
LENEGVERIFGQPLNRQIAVAQVVSTVSSSAKIARKSSARLSISCGYPKLGSS